MNQPEPVLQENSTTISERLRYLIDKIGIKQVHLANKLGVTPQAIHQLCSGKQHFSKHTQKIARLLNADETWLKTGQGTPFPTKQISSTKTILEFPVYHLSQLNRVKDSYARLSSLVSQEIYVTARAYHQKSIGFYVEDNVFAPKFDIGDTILVEPISLENIKNGDLILIYSHELGKTVFCYFQQIKEKNLMGWHPNNNEAPIFFTIHPNDVIYGIYRECLKNF